MRCDRANTKEMSVFLANEFSGLQYFEGLPQCDCGRTPKYTEKPGVFISAKLKSASFPGGVTQSMSPYHIFFYTTNT